MSYTSNDDETLPIHSTESSRLIQEALSKLAEAYEALALVDHQEVSKPRWKLASELLRELKRLQPIAAKLA